MHGTIPNNPYLQNSCERASRWQSIPVKWESSSPNCKAQEHDPSTDRKSNVPSFIVLHPDDEYQPNKAPKRDSEGVPVEEARLQPLLDRVRLVELVTTKSW